MSREPVFACDICGKNFEPGFAAKIPGEKTSKKDIPYRKDTSVWIDIAQLKDVCGECSSKTTIAEVRRLLEKRAKDAATKF